MSFRISIPKNPLLHIFEITGAIFSRKVKSFLISSLFIAVVTKLQITLFYILMFSQHNYLPKQYTLQQLHSIFLILMPNYNTKFFSVARSRSILFRKNVFLLKFAPEIVKIFIKNAGVFSKKSFFVTPPKNTAREW